MFSGGKDSTFSILAARRAGHSVECLLTVRPESDQSHLLHFPDVGFTRLQAESMGIPQVYRAGPGREEDLVRGAMEQARDGFGVRGVVHGGILSVFQRDRFGSACAGLGLEAVAPVWGADQLRHMYRLLEGGFEFMLTSVTADGLDGSWLGRVIRVRDMPALERLARRHSFNISFEGGEAETFVVDCPLFSRPVAVRRARRTWDGYRGRFEILEAGLDSRA